jgi:hypothetical protein
MQQVIIIITIVMIVALQPVETRQQKMQGGRFVKRETMNRGGRGGGE